MMIEIDDLLTPSEAAKKAKMSPQLFRYYVRNDRSPEPIIIRGSTYFDKNEIADWIPDTMRVGRPRNGKNKKGRPA
jgi:hypothetical protein